MPMIAARCAELGARERDGRWTLPSSEAKRISTPKDFVAGYLADPKGLPQGSGNAAVTRPLAKFRVAGGRNSALYSAHSYHTKVPPEAITPFIEYYTKPGDVVLDPFCGSGMTGVAASLAGRRAILNDLSPAAIHLAWNHTRPCDPDDLAAGFAAVEAKVAKRFRALYKTTHTDRARQSSIGRSGAPVTSARMRPQLPLMGSDGPENWSPRQHDRLSACQKPLRRSELKKLGSEPAWIAYETKDGRRYEKAPSLEDIRKALSLPAKQGRCLVS